MYYQPDFLLLISRERQREMIAEAERRRLLRRALRRDRASDVAATGRRPEDASLSAPASNLISCEARAEEPAR
jgi:hypothetical protein